MIADDGSTAADETALASDVFDDLVDVATQHKASLHGKLNFMKANNGALTGTNDRGTKTNISNAGVTTVRVPRASVLQDRNVVNADITLALNQNFGVSSPDQLADHVVRCFPAGTTGIAHGHVDHWNLNCSNKWCGCLSTQMHKIGRNLNLGHSNEAPTNCAADQTGTWQIFD
jgi:hypothetical protein